ncbi:helix-turn-helix domain-containing protein [Haladaptatus sp. CMAA 1911]|uniref:helix-turn-helix domain-containing protein n=1 Tax=unclassified Haladaptatus TaxID=2622732 RepID=UPI003754D382
MDNEDAPSDTVTLDRPVEIRKQLHHFNLIDDGTIVMLYHFRGNLERVSTALTAAPNVLNYDLVDHRDCGGFAYIHCELTDPVKSIISTLHQFEVVLKMPLEFTNEQTIRTTLVGEESAVGDALQAISEIVDIYLEKTGEYRPDIPDLRGTLTNRQHEILTIAVRQGYYQVPRQATIEDIAAAIDLSRATVGEHLQKIEANVFSQIVQ